MIFYIDNVPPPGGEPLTPSYWKNWTTCDGKGNQEETATKNGRWEAGFWLLDDVLKQAVAKGEPITIGLITFDYYSDNGCMEAVNILNDSTVEGTKMGGDAAYHLARNLLAAWLNYGAGAEQCPAATAAMEDAYDLLSEIQFDGTGLFLSAKAVKGDAAKKQQRLDAIAIAEILDDYNNGMLCP